QSHVDEQFHPGTSARQPQFLGYASAPGHPSLTHWAASWRVPAALPGLTGDPKSATLLAAPPIPPYAGQSSVPRRPPRASAAPDGSALATARPAYRKCGPMPTRPPKQDPAAWERAPRALPPEWLRSIPGMG